MLFGHLSEITKTIKLFFIFSLLVLLNACGGGAGNSQLNIGTGGLVIEFPHSLERHITDTMEVKATIILDGGKTYPLVVDKKNKQVSGKIENISKGRHVLVVEYFTIENGEEYSIAKGTINIDVGDLEIVSLNYDEFIYSDDDKDGITNIAELQLKTNPFDSQSIPASHGFHGSENYRVEDQPLDKDISIATGISSSKNYTVQ